ncbi:alpha-ketoglutarate-dependent dioxygenase AlkB [Pseudooceanicola nitratireducens]|uniref:alpha-ketoglutarate-dependent dioxygenase AlkB family protein n=1 Tax=Pseudooceanicola nitratireducens TaxID=517719 RepID=UPI001C939072|nr:alpha-ketoglutarate-dependent dioxygenase AlkB [Pseudooceanicola nitratireducens]MBY6164253.1 alpha-ketoglutarate-dependent dioxygenase AlkB [Pseudooceanicola nitratireducens]
MVNRINLRGFDIYKGYLDAAAQADLIGALRGVLKAAPLFSPTTRFGKQMSVRMTSAGEYGWYSDASGYRYERRHPSGVDWPPIPDQVLQIWRDLTGADRDPQCCLVNYYGEDARMGMHQDRDEADFSYPVLSISLGDDGLFRIGNEDRGGRTESLWLTSGDVVVMGGPARLLHHGVDRIRFGSSRVMPKGGRINLTCRVVD